MTFEEKICEMCKNARVVFIFVSKEDEVETKSVIKQLLSCGKRIVVPVCDSATKTITPSEIYLRGDLVPRTYSILEPKEIIPIAKNEIDIFFVPGTQFDKTGNRKGRGLGYFDRFLQDVKGTKPIIGLCYDDQMVEHIKPKQWDVAVDRIISKKRSQKNLPPKQKNHPNLTVVRLRE